MNAVRPHDGEAAGLRGDRAVVVVGVAVDGAWRFSQFGVTLDHYDLARQAITGDCLGYDRLAPVVPSALAPARYFAFDAPAGAYIYSAFNGAASTVSDQAFEAPAGHAVYVGTFVLGADGRVTLRREIDAPARLAIVRSFPDLSGHLELANARNAAPARPFLCTP